MRILSTLAAVAVVAMVPFASHAQSRPGDGQNAHNHADKTQTGPGAPGGGMMGGGMMGGGMMGGGMMGGGMLHGGMMSHMPPKHVEGRLAFLKTELKITPAQEPQWNKFADSVRGIAKNAQAGTPPMKHGGAAASTPLDRLGQYEKMLVSRLERVRALKAAVDPLYASLSDDQKKLADELLMSPMGIM